MIEKLYAPNSFKANDNGQFDESLPHLDIEPQFNCFRLTLIREIQAVLDYTRCVAESLLKDPRKDETNIWKNMLKQRLNIQMQK